MAGGLSHGPWPRARRAGEPSGDRSGRVRMTRRSHMRETSTTGSGSTAGPRSGQETAAAEPPAPAGVAGPRPRRGLGRLIGRVLLGLLAAVIVIAAAAGLWLWTSLRGSLPLLEGELPLAGLSAPVRIERDALGVPLIRGSGRLDVARATGFVHAQERFFQMDLLRRSAAGELAEIIGPAALERDRQVRVHRFRSVAARVAAAAPPDSRALAEAYAEGVNAGLAALRRPPFEYLALRARPVPWRPEDSALVLLAMFLQLHDDEGLRERTLGVMHETLPPPLFDFLAPRGTEWDAPLVGGPLDVAPLPGPQVVDLRPNQGVARSGAGPRSGAARRATSLSSQEG